MFPFKARKSLFLPTLFAFLAANLSRRDSGSKTERSSSFVKVDRSSPSLSLRTILKASKILSLSDLSIPFTVLF